MTKVEPTLEGLYRDLEPIEVAATRLDWAKQRPWRRSTHIWWEQGLLVVDLHDLDVKLGRRLAKELDLDSLDIGAVCFITGRGRHSVSGRSALRQAVSGVLQARGHDAGWQVRAAGAGRIIVVLDPETAPPHASGALGPVFWLGVVAFVSVAAWLCLGAPGS